MRANKTFRRLFWFLFVLSVLFLVFCDIIDSKGNGRSIWNQFDAKIHMEQTNTCLYA